MKVMKGRQNRIISLLLLFSLLSGFLSQEIQAQALEDESTLVEQFLARRPQYSRYQFHRLARSEDRRFEIVQLSLKERTWFSPWRSAGYYLKTANGFYEIPPEYVSENHYEDFFQTLLSFDDANRQRTNLGQRPWIFENYLTHIAFPVLSTGPLLIGSELIDVYDPHGLLIPTLHLEDIAEYRQIEAEGGRDIYSRERQWKIKMAEKYPILDGYFLDESTGANLQSPKYSSRGLKPKKLREIFKAKTIFADAGSGIRLDDASAIEHADRPFFVEALSSVLGRYSDIEKILGNSVQISFFYDEASDSIRLSSAPNGSTELSINLRAVEEKAFFSLPYEIFKHKEALAHSGVNRPPSDAVGILSIRNSNPDADLKPGDAQRFWKDDKILQTLLARYNSNIQIVNLNASTRLELEAQLAKIVATGSAPKIEAVVSWGHGSETSYNLSGLAEFSGGAWAEILALVTSELESADKVLAYQHSCLTGCTSVDRSFQSAMAIRLQQIQSRRDDDENFPSTFELINHEHPTTSFVIERPDIRFGNDMAPSPALDQVQSLFIQTHSDGSFSTKFLGAALFIASAPHLQNLGLNLAHLAGTEGLQALFLGTAVTHLPSLTAFSFGYSLASDRAIRRQIISRDGPSQLIEVTAERVSEGRRVHPLDVIQPHFESLVVQSSEAPNQIEASKSPGFLHTCIQRLRNAGKMLVPAQRSEK